MLTPPAHFRRAALAIVTASATFVAAVCCVTSARRAYGDSTELCPDGNFSCGGWLDSPGSPGTTATSTGGSSPQACPTPPSGPGYPTNISLDCDGCHWVRVYAMPTDINATGARLQETQEAYDQWQAGDEQGILDELACYPGPTRYLMYFQTPAILGQENSGQLPLAA